MVKTTPLGNFSLIFVWYTHMTPVPRFVYLPVAPFTDMDQL